MGRIRLFGLALLTVFAFGIVVAASASAEEPGLLFLPGAEAPVKVSGKSGVGTLTEVKNKKVIECTSSKFESTSAAGTHITLFIDVPLIFSGCKEGKLACKTEGAGKEEIKVLGDAHFIALLEGTELRPGLAIIVLNAKLEFLDAKKVPLSIQIVCGVGIVEVRGVAFGLLKLGAEVGGGDIETATLDFPTALKCDTSDELCKTLEKTPLEANFTGVYGAAEEKTKAELTTDKMVKVDF